MSELIVVVRGGGETGSAIAHRLHRSHFRVCITEIDSPLALSRGNCFSEAVFERMKTVEQVIAEKTPLSLEQIYSRWRDETIPLVVDPELLVKALIKPDVLVNAMMLKRETQTRISDAPLVIGIGQGFTAGSSVHFVIEANNSNHAGKVIFEGKSEEDGCKPVEFGSTDRNDVVLAEDSGIFSTDKNIGDMVTAGETIGYLGSVPLKARVTGLLRGVLRNEVKVLGGAELAEIDSVHDKSACYFIGDKMRAISGGVLEAIMFALNCVERD